MCLLSDHDLSIRETLLSLHNLLLGVHHLRLGSCSAVSERLELSLLLLDLLARGLELLLLFAEHGLNGLDTRVYSTKFASTESADRARGHSREDCPAVGIGPDLTLIRADLLDEPLAVGDGLHGDGADAMNGWPCQPTHGREHRLGARA